MSPKRVVGCNQCTDLTYAVEGLARRVANRFEQVAITSGSQPASRNSCLIAVRHHDHASRGAAFTG